MSNEKKKNKVVLLIIIPVILIALGVVGYFLYPQISAKLFPKSNPGSEVTESVTSDTAPDVTSSLVTTDPETDAEPTTTEPSTETSSPETTEPAASEAVSTTLETTAPDDVLTTDETTSDAFADTDDFPDETDVSETAGVETTGPETSDETTTSEPVETTEPVTEAETEPPHVHSFGAWETTKEPTCTAVGSKFRVCSCGEKETETIAKLGHSYDSGTVTKAATCSEAGVKTLTCTRCGATKTESIAKLKHSYTSVVTKEPTCVEIGEKTYTCKNCGNTYSDSIPMIAHNFIVDHVVEPTVEAGGYTLYKCKMCGKTEKRDITEALDGDNTHIHNWVVVEYRGGTGAHRVFCGLDQNTYPVFESCVPISIEIVHRAGGEVIPGQEHPIIFQDTLTLTKKCTDVWYPSQPQGDYDIKYECSICHKTKINDFCDWHDVFSMSRSYAFEHTEGYSYAFDYVLCKEGAYEGDGSGGFYVIRYCPKCGCCSSYRETPPADSPVPTKHNYKKTIIRECNALHDGIEYYECTYCGISHYSVAKYDTKVEVGMVIETKSISNNSVDCLSIDYVFNGVTIPGCGYGLIEYSLGLPLEEMPFFRINEDNIPVLYYYENGELKSHLFIGASQEEVDDYNNNRNKHPVPVTSVNMHPYAGFFLNGWHTIGYYTVWGTENGANGGWY